MKYFLLLLSSSFLALTLFAKETDTQQLSKDVVKSFNKYCTSFDTQSIINSLPHKKFSLKQRKGNALSLLDTRLSTKYKRDIYLQISDDDFCGYIIQSDTSLAKDLRAAQNKYDPQQKKSFSKQILTRKNKNFISFTGIKYDLIYNSKIAYKEEKLNHKWEKIEDHGLYFDVALPQTASENVAATIFYDFNNRPYLDIKTKNANIQSVQQITVDSKNAQDVFDCNNNGCATLASKEFIKSFVMGTISPEKSTNISLRLSKSGIKKLKKGNQLTIGFQTDRGLVFSQISLKGISKFLTNKPNKEFLYDLKKHMIFNATEDLDYDYLSRALQTNKNIKIDLNAISASNTGRGLLDIALNVGTYYKLTNTPKVISLLVREGANMDQLLKSILYEDTTYTNDAIAIKVFKMLLDKGLVNPDYRIDGERTLLMLCKNGTTARNIIKSGATLQARDSKGATALHYWAKSTYNGLSGRYTQDNVIGLNKALEYATQYVNIDIEDYEGNTPLMYAVKYSEYPLAIEDFFNNGASQYHKNDRGETIVTIARQRKDKDQEFVERIKHIGEHKFEFTNNYYERVRFLIYYYNGNKWLSSSWIYADPEETVYKYFPPHKNYVFAYARTRSGNYYWGGHYKKYIMGTKFIMKKIRDDEGSYIWGIK